MLLQMVLFHSFLWLSNIPHLCHVFFIHSSVNGHLGSFHVLAIVNSAAVNIGVYVSFQIRVCSGYMPRIGIAGSCGSSIFSFLRNLLLLSIVAAPIYIPTNSVGGFLFLHTLLTFLMLSSGVMVLMFSACQWLQTLCLLLTPVPRTPHSRIYYLLGISSWVPISPQLSMSKIKLLVFSHQTCPSLPISASGITVSPAA